MRTRSHAPVLHALRLAAWVLVAMLALASSRADAQCAGDCNGDGMVAINELIVGVNIALGSAPVSQCPSFDVNADGMVAINELIAAVNNALMGCPDGPTPTQTVPMPTATATPTNGTSPTPTATSGGGRCGNNEIEFGQGETCDDGNTDEGPGDSCPANCRINPCERSGQTLTADVVFATDPSDLLIAGMTLFVRYPDGTVDVPGNNDDPAVQAAVTSDFFGVTPNDSNYGLTAVLIDPFFIGVEAGTAITASLDICEGATAPPASAFTCRVIDASDPALVTVTDQVACSVILR